MQLTNRSGQIEPVAIPVPEIAAGQTPNTGQLPFTRVNLFAKLRGYGQIETEDLQVFPNTLTVQDLEMIPLAELPADWGQKEVFLTPAQNL